MGPYLFAGYFFDWNILIGIDGCQRKYLRSLSRTHEKTVTEYVFDSLYREKI